MCIRLMLWLTHRNVRVSPLEFQPNERMFVCKGDSGGPLMWQFNRRRLVLEGISNGIKNCNKTNVPVVYTQVRSYGAWLRAQLEM